MAHALVGSARGLIILVFPVIGVPPFSNIVESPKERIPRKGTPIIGNPPI